jgi:hypothetical protein
MKLYAYVPREDGTEPVGSSNRMLFELKTIRGAKNRCESIWKNKRYKIYTYYNFYDDSTFKLLYEKK